MTQATRTREPTEPPEPTGTAERLVFFTDAVVAIALTLLVLPLVDLVPEAARDGVRLGALLRENLAQLGAFALSFVVIFRFWWAHHQLFRHISRLNATLVVSTLVWTFSIVFLPVPTAIITAYPPSPGTVALYVGTLVLTSGSLGVVAVTAHRTPALSVGRARETREEVLGATISLGALVLALVVGTVFARTLSYYPLLLLLVGGQVERVIKRRWAAKADRPGEPGRRG